MNLVCIYVLIIIKVSFCCDSFERISFLPPFNDLSNIRSESGKDIVIVCCHPDGADKLLWKNQNGTLSKYNGILIDEKKRLILRIDNLDINTAGEYTCENVNRKLSKSLSITLKPRSQTPIINKVEKVLPKGASIKIECSLNDRQTFKNWVFSEGAKNIFASTSGKRSNYEISEDKLFFTLYLNNAAESVKVIWCQYQEVNLEGDVSTGMYEYSWVLYDPINVRTALVNKEPILEGHDVTLVCHFNPFERQAVAFPANNVKSNFKIDASKEKSGEIRLIIPKFTNHMEDKYECKVTNFLMAFPMRIAEENSTVIIDVIIPPKIIPSDMELIGSMDENKCLICRSDNKHLKKEDIYFERLIFNSSAWFKLDDKDNQYDLLFNRTNNRSTLKLCIRNIQWTDRGQYRCTASNLAGKDNFITTLKVKKLPSFATEDETFYIGVKPIKIDCSVFGYPLPDSNDIVELKVIEGSESIVVKNLKRQYDDMGGLIVNFEVSNQRKLSEGTIYILECYYHNIKKSIKISKSIKLKVSDVPYPPKVSVLCTGSSGVVFQYEIPKFTNTPRDVTENKLFYAPTSQYESLVQKPEKIIPFNTGDNQDNKITYVLTNLLPSTNYSFKWESYNSFQISSFLNIQAETKKLSKPETPQSLTFSTKGNNITVNVTWDDKCSYSGASSAIKDIVVKMQTVNRERKWSWVESNFTLDMDTRSLQFYVSLENPHVDYEIEVMLRNTQGNSNMIKSVYTANVVLAGSLYSCFPRCSSQMLFNSKTGFQTVILISLVSLIFRTEYCW